MDMMIAPSRIRTLAQRFYRIIKKSFDLPNSTTGWVSLLGTTFFFSKPKENDNSGAPQRDMELSPFASSSGGRRRRGRRTEEQPYFRKWPVLITLVITIMSRLELSMVRPASYSTLPNKHTGTIFI